MSSCRSKKQKKDKKTNQIHRSLFSVKPTLKELWSGSYKAVSRVFESVVPQFDSQQCGGDGPQSHSEHHRFCPSKTQGTEYLEWLDGGSVAEIFRGSAAQDRYEVRRGSKQTIHALGALSVCKQVKTAVACCSRTLNWCQHVVMLDSTKSPTVDMEPFFFFFFFFSSQWKQWSVIHL